MPTQHSDAVSRLPILQALVLSAFSAVASAQPKAPPPPTTFFTDPARLIPQGIASQIEQRLRDLETESSNQVLVVVANHVPEGYTSMEEYTNRTAQAWGAGNKSRSNGAVLFVFIGDRKMRIEVGYGLEGALPDALASRIINDEIAPRFRTGQYGEGLLAGVNAIALATKGEYKPLQRPAVPQSTPNGFFWLIVVVVVFFVCPLALVLGGLFLYLRWIVTAKHRPSSSDSGRSFSRWGVSSASSDWGRSSSSSSSSRSSSSGGGGFSGGGGSFGGGGASGSW